MDLTPLQAAILLGAPEPTGRRTVWMSEQQYRRFMAAKQGADS